MRGECLNHISGGSLGTNSLVWAAQARLEGGALLTSSSISGKENVTDCVILADGRGSCTRPGCVVHQLGGQKLLSQEKPLSHDFPSYGEVAQQEDVPVPVVG